MSAPLDAPVREQITGELDRNLLVEAGAGSGKTTSMVARIAALVRTGAAQIDEVVAITFTEAAASELSTRLRLHLDELLIDGCGSDMERLRIEQAQRDLYRARFETIHSFAANLLRERPVEAGIDPAFEIVSGVDEQLERERAVSGWLRKLLDGDSQAPDSALVLKAMRRGFDPGWIETLGDQFFTRAALLGEVEFAPPAPLELDDLRQQLERWSVVFAELSAQYDPNLDPKLLAGEDTSFDKCFLGLTRALEFAQACTGTNSEELAALLLGFKPPSPTAGSQKRWPGREGCVVEAKALLKEFRDALAAAAQHLRRETLHSLLPLAVRFAKQAARERRTRGRLNFDDLLVFSRDLVRDSESAREYFQQRFQRIFVDEFQDTDPVQMELLLRLASPASGEWQSLQVEPGRLFLVGDPKQSIYRFRGADIGAYDSLACGLLAGDRVTLDQNFRSQAGVLQFINSIFEPIFAEGRAGLRPAYQALVADRPATDATPVTYYELPEAEGGSADQHDLEAFQLARAIALLVGEQRVQVPDGDRTRPLRYGDIAVLYRVRTHVFRLERELARLGVPFRREADREYFRRQEVRDLAACLRAVVDPIDQIALVGALRSAAFGCNDDQLASFVAGGQVLSVEADPEGEGEVASALRALRALRQDHHDSSPAEVVAALLEQTALLRASATYEDGTRAVLNLHKLARDATQFSATGRSAREFARWIEFADRRSSDEADASTIEAGEDTVSLTTVHTAKGREFPLVALYAPLIKFSDRPDHVVVDALSGRVEVGFGPSAGRWATERFDSVEPSRREHEEAQFERLLYVALTRAQDHLLLPAVVREPEGVFEQAIRSGYEVDEQGQITVTAPEGKLLLASELKEAAVGQSGEVLPTPLAADELVSIIEQAEQARRELIVVASAAASFVVASGDHRAAQDGSEVSADEHAEMFAVVSGSAERAVRVGRAVHEVMELTPLGGSEPDEQLVVHRAEEHEVSADEVRELATSTLNSEVVRRAAVAERQWRELPITFSGVSGSLAAGRIDLMFEQSDGIVVVDYKTDQVEPGQAGSAARLHRDQAAFYVAALEQMGGGSVSEVVFVFARTGEQGSVAVDQDLRDRGAELIGSAAAVN